MRKKEDLIEIEKPLLATGCGGLPEEKEQMNEEELSSLSNLMLKERALSQTNLEESKTSLVPKEGITGTTSSKEVVKSPIQSLYTGCWPNREKKAQETRESPEESQSPTF